MKSVLLLAFMALISLSATRCGKPQEAASSKPKWKNYNERLEEDEQQARKGAKLRARSLLVAGELQGEWKVAGLDSFDREGHLVLSRFYDGGRVTKELLNHYENGRLVATVQTDERGPLRVTFNYDGKGNKVSEYITNPVGDTTITRKYTHDEAGNEIEAEFWRKDINKRATKRTTYDAERRPVSVKEYEGDTQNWEEKYKHVGQERLEADRYDADGLVDRHFVMHFDKEGRSTKMEQFDRANNRKMLVLKSYDANGRPSKEENLNSKDDVMESSVFSYDTNGMLSKRMINSGGTETEVRYENRYYDK